MLVRQFAKTHRIRQRHQSLKLDQLPKDILSHIVSFLSLKEVGVLSLTNKTLNESISKIETKFGTYAKIFETVAFERATLIAHQYEINQMVKQESSDREPAQDYRNFDANPELYTLQVATASAAGLAALKAGETMETSDNPSLLKLGLFAAATIGLCYAAKKIISPMLWSPKRASAAMERNANKFMLIATLEELKNDTIYPLDQPIPHAKQGNTG